MTLSVIYSVDFSWLPSVLYIYLGLVLFDKYLIVAHNMKQKSKHNAQYNLLSEFH